jgi:hypothetical protein
MTANMRFSFLMYKATVGINFRQKVTGLFFKQFEFDVSEKLKTFKSTFNIVGGEE